MICLDKVCILVITGILKVCCQLSKVCRTDDSCRALKSMYLYSIKSYIVAVIRILNNPGIAIDSIQEKLQREYEVADSSGVFDTLIDRYLRNILNP